MCTHRYWIGECKGGMATETCRLCGFHKRVNTEFELAIGMPIKSRGYSQMNLLSRGRNGVSPKDKFQLYEDNKGEMIRIWKEEGDYGVISRFPIHISTWTRYKKWRWKLVPNIDNRIRANQKKDNKWPIVLQ